MENNEILNQLAMAVNSIVDDQVAKRAKSIKPTSESVVEMIQTCAFDGEIIEDILSAIRGNYGSQFADAAYDYIEDNSDDYVKIEDIDSDWVCGNLNENELSQIAKNVVNNYL